MASSTERRQPDPLAVRLEESDAQWLKDRRDDTGTSVNSMVKTAVSQYRRRIEAAERRRSGDSAST